MVLERKILSSPRGFKGLSNPSRVHARLICWSLPVLGMDKGLALFVSFHTLNGRRVLPAIVLGRNHLGSLQLLLVTMIRRRYPMRTYALAMAATAVFAFSASAFSPTVAMGARGVQGAPYYQGRSVGRPNCAEMRKA